MADPNTLSPVDTAWFRLDEEANTADIVGLIRFCAPVAHSSVRDVVAARFAQFPEFTRRVVDPGGARLPHWEHVPDFRIEDHIEVARLDAGTHDELQRFLSRVLTLRLRRDRPLWRMWLVDNVDGGSALIVKIHHCLGDGFAMVGVLLTLCDQPPLPSGGEAPDVDSRQPSLGAQLWKGVVDAVRHPERVVDAAKTSGKMAAALGELLLLSFDSPTSLRAELTGVRHAAWSGGLDLNRFKTIARTTGGTVNDVLLTVLSGALRAVLLLAGDDVDQAAIRAMIPVNLRPLDEIGKELGNKFGLVFIDMPVQEAELTDRRTRIRRSMNELKESPQAIVAFGVLGALGLGPEVVEHLAGEVFTRKASLVVTNVPGPRERLRLADVEIDHIMFWVPHPALLGLGVSLLSYAGEVRIGVRADAAVMADPQVLVDAFEAELVAMEESLSEF